MACFQGFRSPRGVSALANRIAFVSTPRRHNLMEKEFKVELGFVQRVLPWIVGGGALVLYLVTLNHAATFAGLAKLAQVAGWDWRPTIVAPLHFLITLPVRWLPPGLQLVALNFLSAVCSALA